MINSLIENLIKNKLDVNLKKFMKKYNIKDLNVEKIDLSASKLETIPEYIINFKNLKKLDLSFNYITDLSIIKSIKSLEILLLSGNRELMDLSPIKNLENLTILSIPNKNIKINKSDFKNTHIIDDYNNSIPY